jgi:hypothetical protein
MGLSDPQTSAIVGIRPAEGRWCEQTFRKAII